MRCTQRGSLHIRVRASCQVSLPSFVPVLCTLLIVKLFLFGSTHEFRNILSQHFHTVTLCVVHNMGLVFSETAIEYILWVQGLNRHLLCLGEPHEHVDTVGPRK